MNVHVRLASGLVIHGGVGTLPREVLTTDMEQEYRESLAASLSAGHAVLAAGGSACDAAVAAVQIMEDSPLFNAGRGSNFDERGVVTMDASIMDGAGFRGGAIAGVTDVRSPVRLAQLVMERSPHVLLIGEGAEAFARAHGIDATEASFFHTERRWAEMEQAKARGDVRPNVLGDATDMAGTVGAVALDRAGRLAAATSTGGMANKPWGRVGDTPIHGAGTYASDRCAVSCTGWGEYFILNATAHDVHARMVHAGATLAEAAHGVIFDTLERQVPRSGGLVALDAAGNAQLCFNTPGMYRGWIGPDGSPRVAIYREAESV
jgi:beta-aspartyl-peptidase (threonine type)